MGEMSGTCPSCVLSFLLVPAPQLGKFLSELWLCGCIIHLLGSRCPPHSTRASALVETGASMQIHAGGYESACMHRHACGCVYMHYMQLYTCVYAHIDACTCRCLGMCSCVLEYACSYPHMCIYTQVYACRRVCRYMHVHLCRCTYVCVSEHNSISFNCPGPALPWPGFF